MLIFIDESGDPGFKSPRKYFVFSLVGFYDIKEAEKTNEAIDRIRKEMGYPVEFKFCKRSNKHRKLFFNGIQKSNFFVKSIIINKHNIKDFKLKKDANHFYKFFLKKLLIKSDIKNAFLKLDGTKNIKIKRSLVNYIRKDTNNIVKKFRLIDSRKDNLIQLADMVTSGIAYAYHHKNKKNSDAWKKLLKNKIKETFLFNE